MPTTASTVQQPFIHLSQSNSFQRCKNIIMRYKATRACFSEHEASIKRRKPRNSLAGPTGPAGQAQNLKNYE
jgi:hypothetical protein